MRLSPPVPVQEKSPGNGVVAKCGARKTKDNLEPRGSTEKRSWLEFAMPPLPEIPFDEQDATFFHTPNGIAYADVQINGHRETWPICSTSFRNFLRRCSIRIGVKRSARENSIGRCNNSKLKPNSTGPKDTFTSAWEGLRVKSTSTFAIRNGAPLRSTPMGGDWSILHPYGLNASRA